MNDFFRPLSDDELNAAKSRIWNSVQGKLPNRGLSRYQSVVRKLKSAHKDVKVSRLLKVQAKEQLLERLPDRVPVPSFMERINALFFRRRAWAAATLSVFFAVTFAPFFQFSPLVSAETTNMLEVAQGEAVIVRGEDRISVRDVAVLFEGDRIMTREGSMAHVQFIDDSRLTLGPDSDVLLTELFMHPGNRARTEIVIDQFDGRVWSQVLNLVSEDSFYALRFPDGEIVVRQRASFDVNIGEDTTEVQVARNLVEAMVVTEDVIHEGTLGQGAKMVVTNGVETGELTESEKTDVWWDFNLSYGKTHAQSTDLRYRQAVKEVMILPGHPLYPIKSFQENVQDMMAFSDESKRKLAVEHAGNRLIEAQALLAQGNESKAQEVLEEFDKVVDDASLLSNSDDMIASLEESKKELFVSDEEGTELLESHLQLATNVVIPGNTEKTQTKMVTASQKLQRVPDLIEDGDFDLALEYLKEYQDKSLSTLVELESVPLEERQEIVQTILDKKLKDLQMLRVIAAMPELSGVMDIEAQLLQEMSMMVLSLRERELDHLSEFVNADHYEQDVQMALYNRLKESVDLDPEVDGQFEELEEGINQIVATGSVVVELQTSPVEKDPRLLNSHADEPQEQTDSGTQGTDDPETHDNL